MSDKTVHFRSGLKALFLDSLNKNLDGRSMALNVI